MSNPNWAGALSHIARCKTYIGLMEEAIALQEQAIRLDPRDAWHRGILFPHWGSAFAAITHRRGDCLVGEGARRDARASSNSAFPRLGLCPQRRDWARRRDTRRSPAAKPRPPCFKHRPLKGRSLLPGAEGGCFVRKHLSRRSAQSRHAGGMTRRRDRSSSRNGGHRIRDANGILFRPAAVWMQLPADRPLCSQTRARTRYGRTRRRSKAGWRRFLFKHRPHAGGHTVTRSRTSVRWPRRPYMPA